MDCIHPFLIYMALKYNLESFFFCISKQFRGTLFSDQIYFFLFIDCTYFTAKVSYTGYNNSLNYKMLIRYLNSVKKVNDSPISNITPTALHKV